MSGGGPRYRRSASADPTLPRIPVSSQCRETIERGALVAVNSSGGKDSQAMTILLSRIVPREQIDVVHAPLGEVEWPGTIERELRRYLKTHARFGSRPVNAMSVCAEESAARAGKRLAGVHVRSPVHQGRSPRKTARPIQAPTRLSSHRGGLRPPAPNPAKHRSARGAALSPALESDPADPQSPRSPTNGTASRRFHTRRRPGHRASLRPPPNPAGSERSRTGPIPVRRKSRRSGPRSLERG